MTHEVITIGLYVIFGFIMLPVYLMILGWLIGKPRDYRTVALTFGYMIGFVVLIVVGLAVTGGVISIVTPY